jgi:hypothetical protein
LSQLIRNETTLRANLVYPGLSVLLHVLKSLFATHTVVAASTDAVARRSWLGIVALGITSAFANPAAAID